MAVLMVDVDDFKAINDNHGHLVGNEDLIAVAKRLRRSVRPDDVVARLGASSEPDLIHARIDAELDMPILTSAGPLSVRVSVGVGSLTVGDTPGDLLRMADQSMYRHKRKTKVAFRWLISSKEGCHTRAVSLNGE